MARRFVWTALTMVGALAVVLQGVPAKGEPAPDAEQLVSQGILLRRQHEDASALELFRRAYELDKSGRAMAQIALAEQALGRWPEAERDIQLALREEGDPWVARNRGALNEALADISKHVGGLDLDANVPGAELLIDGKPAGVLPAKGLRVAAGKIALEIRAAGHVPARFNIEVPAGGSVQEHVELSRLPAPPRAEWTAQVHPGVGPAPAGRAIDGAASIQRTVALVMLGAGGITLLAGGVAHVFRERSLDKYNDDSMCFNGSLTRDQRCGKYKEDAETAQTVMTLGYAMGGIAVTTAVVLLITQPRGHPTGSLLSLAPTPGGANLAYATTF